MDPLLQNRSCEDFTALLASSAPAPGGGGAAALSGALAAALCSMAAVLTASRKKYAERKEALEALAAAAQAESRALLALIDADAEGFLPLAAAYKLPKDAPDTAEALRRATLTACQAPMALLRRCVGAGALLERALEEASPALLSDVGCGAALCRGALEAGAMNVFVNTRTLPGDAGAQALEAEAKALLGDWIPRLERITRRVFSALTGETDG